MWRGLPAPRDTARSLTGRAREKQVRGGHSWRGAERDRCPADRCRRTHLAGLAARQVPGDAADVAHVLPELGLVPPRRQLHLALQRRQLRQQRLLPPAPAQGLPLQLGTRLGGAAAPQRPWLPRRAARGEPGTAPGLGGAGRPEAARSEVGGQLPQPHGAAAAPGAVVALDLQLLDEAAEGQHGPQLGGRQRPAAQGAAAAPRRPGQQAAGTENVPARSGQRLLQHPPAQPALQLRRHRPREPGRVEAHGAARAPPNFGRRDPGLAPAALEPLPARGGRRSGAVPGEAGGSAHTEIPGLPTPSRISSLSAALPPHAQPRHHLRPPGASSLRGGESERGARTVPEGELCPRGSLGARLWSRRELRGCGTANRSGSDCCALVLVNNAHV